jgi:protein required for attachment to host cells
MQLPNGATVAVADGEKFNLFRNDGDEAGLKLIAVDHGAIDDHKRSDAGRQNSSANPDASQANEDGYSAGVAAWLNKNVLEGKIAHLLVIAAPRTLGAVRQHYHAKLSAILVGEIARDLTGHSLHDVEKAVAAA